MEHAVETAAIDLGIARNAGTGGKMQGSVAPGDILPLAAEVTEPIRSNQPNASQDRVVALGDPVSDGPKDVLEATLLSGRDHDLRKLMGVHMHHTTKSQ